MIQINLSDLENVFEIIIKFAVFILQKQHICKNNNAI